MITMMMFDYVLYVVHSKYSVSHSLKRMTAATIATTTTT